MKNVGGQTEDLPQHKANHQQLWTALAKDLEKQFGVAEGKSFEES